VLVCHHALRAGVRVRHVTALGSLMDDLDPPTGSEWATALAWIIVPGVVCALLAWFGYS
jgi:hypothetical protein